MQPSCCSPSLWPWGIKVHLSLLPPGQSVSCFYSCGTDSKEKTTSLATTDPNKGSSVAWLICRERLYVDVSLFSLAFFLGGLGPSFLHLDSYHLTSCAKVAFNAPYYLEGMTYSFLKKELQGSCGMLRSPVIPCLEVPLLCTYIPLMGVQGKLFVSLLQAQIPT